MFKDADPLAIAILTIYAIALVASVIVLAVGFWLIRKMYRQMLARQQRFAGLIATVTFLLLVLLVKVIFSMVL